MIMLWLSLIQCRHWVLLCVASQIWLGWRGMCDIKRFKKVIVLRWGFRLVLGVV